MRTKFTSYLLQSYGFKLLLITSLLYACEPTEIKNPGLIISSSQGVPDGWELVKNKNFSITQSKIKSFNKPLISATLPGEIAFSQTITLDSGDHFLMAKYKVNVVQGSFFLKTSDKTGIKIYSSDTTCLRTIFTIPVKEEQEINVQFGFSEGSIGQALIDTIFVYSVEYKVYDNQAVKGKVDLIENNLSLSLKDYSQLDQNIDLFAGGINAAFLNKEEETSQNFRVTYASGVFNDEITNYLATFINDENVRDAYCQKSSLSLDELLRLYQIPTRQLHWQKKCSGFHQFLEYYDAHDSKWKIIDPYYGIRYIDKIGNYLGFEEIEKLVRNNSFTRNNIKQMNIGHLYYSESEILEGWLNSGLAVHVLNK